MVAEARRENVDASERKGRTGYLSSVHPIIIIIVHSGLR
jgi:hypothetical protein